MRKLLRRLHKRWKITEMLFQVLYSASQINRMEKYSFCFGLYYFTHKKTKEVYFFQKIIALLHFKLPKSPYKDSILFQPLLFQFHLITFCVKILYFSRTNLDEYIFQFTRMFSFSYTYLQFCYYEITSNFQIVAYFNECVTIPSNSSIRRISLMSYHY